MHFDAEIAKLAKSTLVYLTPFLLAALAGLGTLYKLERDKRHEIEKRLDEHKSEIYAKLIEDYTAMFFKPGGKEHTEEYYINIVERIQHFARNALIYASDEVVEKFSIFYKLQNTAVENMSMSEVYARLNSFSDVVIAIRRELGHSKTKLSYDTIGSLLITDYDSQTRPS